jgi:hypothetical protein
MLIIYSGQKWEDKMGGSSGGYFRSSSSELKKMLVSAEQGVKNQEYESDVLEQLNALLSQFNDRDVEKINTHLEEITKTIENKIDENLKILLGGSVSKHTYVDGISDIDALIVLNGTDLQQKSPTEIRKMFAAMLKERFPRTEISVGKMAVTLKFQDCEIQILPAIKNKAGIIIPDNTGTKWSKINPEAFTKKLTEVNSNNGKKVIPVIKLAKALISNFPENQQLSGYHVESMAIEVFKNYHEALNTKAMLKEFFKLASNTVLSPIKDKTGQSFYVDDYLGNANSQERQIISGALNRVYKRLSNADNAQSITIWEDIFE